MQHAAKAEHTAEAAEELFCPGPDRSPRNSLPMVPHTACLEFYWLPSALLIINALLSVLRPPGHSALSLSLGGHSFPFRLLDALVAPDPLPFFGAILPLRYHSGLSASH